MMLKKTAMNKLSPHSIEKQTYSMLLFVIHSRY